MKKQKKKTFEAIGLLLIALSFLIPHYISKKDINKEKERKLQIETYLDKTSQLDEFDNSISNDQEPQYDYIAILEIPDINLKRGLLSLSNKYNSVEYNVQVIEGSQMPDIPRTNLVLASHSGTSNVSYFRELEKLKINSEVLVYYQGYKYTYKISEYETIPKTGTISIERDKYQNTITLITCKKDNNDEQIAYIGYLTNKIIY